MDDDVADLVTDEVRSFFISITTPFLDRLSEDDKHNAKSWSQRVMQINNYPLMKNYLILLSFMIFSGRVVSPFDVDCHKRKLPRIPAFLEEDRLFEYVQGEIVRKIQKEVHEATESALSRDELAFLAQLPAPKGGIRLYLATSDTPYSSWSKVHKFPAPAKYDISAKDFTIEGLDLVRHKFEESETRQVDEGRPFTCTTSQPEQTPRNSDVSEMRSHNLPNQLDDLRVPDQHNDSSAYEYDSPLNSPVIKEPRVQIIGRKKPEVFKCTIDVPPDHKAIIEEVADIVLDDLPDSPPKMVSDEDFQKEQKILQKADRWFGDPMYTRYMDIIKKLLRRKIPVDSIRRSIHRCMRQRYKPGTTIPNWLRDSLDETEPWHMRIAHLKMRFSDVLKNEYGVADEDELFLLSNTPALSENDECKARELIRRAEEGRIDPAMRNKFTVEENRSCKRLLKIIDEILNSDYDPDAPPAAPAAGSADQPHGAEPQPWKCNLETAHSMARKSYEASQLALKRSSLDSSRLSSQQGSNSQNGSFSQNVQNGSSQPDQNGSQRRENSITGQNGANVNHLPSNNKCCPSGFQVDAMRSRQSRSCDREAPKRDSKEFEFSTDSELGDFNLEDERPDELFANLPPDSSTEDGSLNQSRKIDKSSKRNSK